MRKKRSKRRQRGGMKGSPPLPISKEEAKRYGIDQFDVILVSGDGYVDHPSFGVGLIGRVLQDAGLDVGIIPQPDCRRDEDFSALGEPRLFFGVASGNVDSMVNNYSPNKKRRRRDVYSPGGRLLRPDRASVVYANKVHALFPKTPSSWAGSKRAFGGSPTTTSGRIPSGVRSWRTLLRAWSSSGWGRDRFWR